MKLKIETPNERQAKRLREDYYEYNEELNGRSPLRRLSLNNIRKDKEESTALLLADQNYANTLESVKRIYASPYCKFVGLYADDEINEDYIIAHSTITLPMFEDEDVVSVSDIFVKNKEHLRETEGCDINIVLNTYCIFIDFIEDAIYACEKYSQIDYITSGKDGDFWEALRLNGYEIANCPDLVGTNYLRFSKIIRERDVTRGRNNPDQQN